jgi:BirA family transcriptional regulator, biotin operon repressor / biotin---[acetyl-CoA-carboxylase] ligase
MAFGAPHRHYRLTDSTNARARELVEAGAPHGTVVTAAEQSAGRGRQGRVWTAPAGKGLLYSAILRPLDERHLLLPLSVPLAVCEAAEALRPGIECAIKWPNDVWLEERKLAGILIEAKIQDGWAVIGVGLNLAVAPAEFPDELSWPAVSLWTAGRSVEGSMDLQRSTRALETSRRALDRALDRWVDAPGEEILAAWRSRDALRGREISWDGGSGIADGIEDSGDLVVVAGGDRLVLGAGEVHLSL